MDVSGLQESFGRAVMAGCLVISAALVLACLVQLARGACRWSARTIRKVGVATFLVVGILAAWATYTGTPTLQDKSDAASRREGEAETTRQPAITARPKASCIVAASTPFRPSYLNTSAKLRGRTSARNHSSAGTGPRRVALRRFQSELNSHAGAAESSSKQAPASLVTEAARGA